MFFSPTHNTVLTFHALSLYISQRDVLCLSSLLSWQQSLSVSLHPMMLHFSAKRCAGSYLGYTAEDSSHPVIHSARPMPSTKRVQSLGLSCLFTDTVHLLGSRFLFLIFLSLQVSVSRSTSAIPSFSCSFLCCHFSIML